MPDPDLGIREGGGVGGGQPQGGKPFGPQFGLKIRGGGGARGPSPGSASAFQKKTTDLRHQLKLPYPTKAKRYYYSFKIFPQF